MRKAALSGFVTVLTMSTFHAGPSSAAWICPNGAGPGEIVVGMAPTGGGGQAPLCEQVEGGQQAPGQQAPPRSGNQGLEAATGLLQGVVNERYQAVRRQYEELMRSPFKSLPENGAWGFGQGKGFCEARFGSKDGIITLFQYATSRGPSQAFAKGSGLSFTGFGIPTPKTEKRVHVTFEQDNAGPQTVDAIYGPFGAVIGNLTIRDTAMTKDGFESMPDHADFRITIDGKQVFTMGWRDAAHVRDRLRQCTAGGVAARGPR